MHHFSVVGLGEALFDCFPQRTVLGGAPLNVAFHAHQLLARWGGAGYVASRVGMDDLGDQLVDELSRRQLNTDYIQRDQVAPTGTVHVTLSASGEPTYEIVEEVAWDRLAFDTRFEELASRCSAVCFGTLAQRTPASRQTIQRFLEAASDALRVFDVNLRQHYYSAELIEASLRSATMAKLNESELGQCAGLLSIQAPSGDLDQLASRLRDAFELDAVAVTRGPRGAVLFSSEGRCESDVPQYDRAPEADSVGAGDACCAGLIVGCLLELGPQETVKLANATGAFVAHQAGATPELPEQILRLATGGRRHSG